MTCNSWAGPRPSALLRAGVRLSRGPLRCRAAHHSRWSCPSHPSRIPPTLQLLSATTALRSGPPHSAPCANAAPRSSLLASLFTPLAMAPVAAFGRPPLPQTPPHGPLPAGQPAAHRRLNAPLPGRARPQKGPHAARQHPLMRPQATGQKKPATCSSSLRSGHAGQIIRPASRRVSLGSTPDPRHHAPADARSSSSGSAASRWSAAPPSSGRLRRVSIGGLSPPPSPRARHLGCCVSAGLVPFPVG